ncbi:MAG: sugar nucleotide-binding protein [Acidobacteria bacterium]|nr:sugar nucleotide-binding protein [Acidobacteriota bacterium]
MTRTTPRVVVLGGSGFLGSYLIRRLPSSFPTVAVAGRTATPNAESRVEWLPMRIDAGDRESVRTVLAASHADVVVNAIGAKPPVDDVATMERVNGNFPRELAALAGASGARVVNVSTDAVFSGARGGYSELDAPDPIDEYGQSKLGGELRAPHLTLRTSFFGRNRRGAGLIDWLVAQHGVVPGYVDYRFSGVAVAILADLIARAIEAGLAGLYHVGGDPINKFDLLRAAAARLQLDVEVAKTSHGAVDRTLESKRFFAAIGGRRPTLADSIEALSLCGELSRS